MVIIIQTNCICGYLIVKVFLVIRVSYKIIKDGCEVKAHNYCYLGYYGYVFVRGYWHWLKKLFGNFRLDHFLRDDLFY